MAIILDGKKVRDDILAGLAKKISGLALKPCLAILQVGQREESNAYINQKKKFGAQIGVDVRHVVFSTEVSEREVLEAIQALNADKSVHSILLQLPLPETLDKETLIQAIDPRKDVDGLHSANMKNLISGEPGLIPATAKGVLRLLEAYNIEVKGKNVLVIGASMLVGKPIALNLLNHDATVTIAHRETADVAELSRAADIVIVAAGSPKLVTKEFVVPGQTIVDVGITSIEDEESSKRLLVGDVDFEEVSKMVAAISPVPGGVGPMTIACLFENVLEAYQLQQQA